MKTCDDRRRTKVIPKCLPCYAGDTKTIRLTIIFFLLSEHYGIIFFESYQHFVIKPHSIFINKSIWPINIIIVEGQLRNMSAKLSWFQTRVLFNQPNLAQSSTLKIRKNIFHHFNFPNMLQNMNGGIYLSR